MGIILSSQVVYEEEFFCLFYPIFWFVTSRYHRWGTWNICKELWISSFRVIWFPHFTWLRSIFSFSCSFSRSSLPFHARKYHWDYPMKAIALIVSFLLLKIYIKSSIMGSLILLISIWFLGVMPESLTTIPSNARFLAQFPFVFSTYKIVDC